MTTLVLLLRGINVGPSTRLAMADLRKLVGDLGYEGARTHLQSGNMLLDATGRPEAVARKMERAIEEGLGLSVDVVTRTADELAAVVAADPLGDVATDPARRLVVFLSREPDQAALSRLEQEDFGPERFAARGRELHLWCPDGIRDSRLAKAAGGRELAPTATARNWRTVTRLLELARE